jgi:protein-tyrosine phosphatase
MKLKVLSHFLFDEEMEKMGLNDGNVESTNNAYISIIGTPECLNYYLDEGDTKHFFNDRPNVLNLDFDDISMDVKYNGHIFRTITMEQAEKAVDFIERVVNNGVDEIIIHCRAGMSRSRAFAEWIYRYCKEHDIDVEYSDRNDYTTMLNQGVLRRLNHAYWKKHNINGYEDNSTEYPDDLVNVPVVTINREKKQAYEINEE